MRAKELSADVVLKGTKVDGVYDSDPCNSSATKYDSVSYKKVINKNLRVMDLTAITLCKENNLPIQVFNINIPGNLKRLILGAKIGTVVCEEQK